MIAAGPEMKHEGITVRQTWQEQEGSWAGHA